MELDLSEEEQNFDEYNRNNRLVNDVNYSYYFNKNKDIKTNTDNNNDDTKSNNNLIKSVQNINKDNNLIQNNIETNDNEDINYSETLNNKVLNHYNKYNFNSSKISSSIDIKADEKQRKKILLKNIQAQINLRKKTKLEELKKTKEEDAKYFKEMIEKYPFGRGGGGAPNRNKKGEVLAFRRNLISDMKYNQSGINVDDDYNEVWGKRKNNYNNNNNNLNNYNNNNNLNKNVFNNYNQFQKPYSTIKRNIINNSMNNYGNYKMSSPNIFSNYNKYNNDLDKKIYERRMKFLELEKEQEEIKNKELKEENTKLENVLYSQNKLDDKKIIVPTETDLNEEEYESETTTTNNQKNNYNNINNNNNNLKQTSSISNEIPNLNSKNYYDNINFLPNSKINQRLDNNFLFSDELLKLKRDFDIKQMSLLKQISKLKEDSLEAKNERNKVYKDLELIKFQLKKLNEKNKKPEKKVKDGENDTNNNNDNNKKIKVKDKFNTRYLNKSENKCYNIDDMFFRKFENELPNISKIKKEKKIFHLEKNYEDRNLIELDKLIKKNDEIIQNFKENELFEKRFNRKPENYFDTSDYFFDTYMLKHKNDYIDYAKEYNVNNKFMEYVSDGNNINNNDEDYEIKIEKI